MIYRLITTHTFMFLLLSQITYAQEKEMYIFKNDGTIIRQLVSEIDSIKFYSTCEDFDGNTYKTVIINGKEWMAENLKVTHYNDGTPIPYVPDYNYGQIWSGLSSGAYCVYNNDDSNADTYGYLYNWYTVETGKLAPTGWHIPTDDEWEELAQYISDSNGGYSKINDDWYDVGKHLKDSLTFNGTDDHGFNALPAGYMQASKGFSQKGYEAYFWSATDANVNNDSWYRKLSTNDSFYRSYVTKKEGYSIRCVRD